MKKLLILLFSILISFNSFGEWKKVGENAGGTYYIDSEKIREGNRYVYWWSLSDYKTPNSYGDMSSKVYNETDCEVFRTRILTGDYYEQPMGMGSSVNETSDNPKWIYPTPGSSREYVTKYICDYIK
ncbi:hypothetical protein N9R34_01350 [Candidatus Thioglobus sp.]|nr:hypothetical protein [Candidatus Thioglobus sp.]MDB4099178.1 hypothetical protein [Candidatus Thioglobus sp.]